MDNAPSENKGDVSVAWSGVYVTALITAAQGLAFYAFFLYQRKRAKLRMDLYEPRQFTRSHRSPEPFPSGTPWWKAAMQVDDPTLLKYVGLDMYMFLRFLRMGMRICALGCILAAGLIPVYYTGEVTGAVASEFNSITLARVETDSLRLWASLGAWYIFCAYCLQQLERVEVILRPSLPLPCTWRSRYSATLSLRRTGRNGTRGTAQ